VRVSGVYRVRLSVYRPCIHREKAFRSLASVSRRKMSAYALARHANATSTSSSAVNSEANARRIALVESCFGASGQPLAAPSRVLVGEGVLTKACRKKLKPRQFFLFNDVLVYGNIIINKKKYNKQHVIPLEEVSHTLSELNMLCLNCVLNVCIFYCVQHTMYLCFIIN